MRRMGILCACHAVARPGGVSRTRNFVRCVERLSAAIVTAVWPPLVESLPHVLKGYFALPGRIDTRPVVDRDALERLVLIFGEV
jgi:hypothetical protein